MANITISLDDNDKVEISDFCNQIGMSVSSLFNVFVKAVLREGKIPFEVGIKRPNKKTIFAMKEGDRLVAENTPAYDVEEALKELKK